MRAKIRDAGAETGAAAGSGSAAARAARSDSVRWAERVAPISGLYRSSHGRLPTQTDRMPASPTAARHDGWGAGGARRSSAVESSPSHRATTGAAARNHQTVIRTDIHAGTTKHPRT